MSCDFYKTRMGQRFFEHTLPNLVTQIERLNNTLERLFPVQPTAVQQRDSKEKR